MEVLKPANFLQDSSNEHPQECRNDAARSGTSGLLDRGSRPAHCPQRSAATKAERAVALRCNQRLTYECIANRVGPSRSGPSRPRQHI